MRKLLIVDDEKEALVFLKMFFQAKGFDVLTAESGEEAIRKVKEEHPHVVLLDILMPGMSGLEALKIIREIDPEVGVIMATVIQEEDIAKRAIELGAYDYVVKPFDIDYLEMTVLIKLLKMIG
jgi:DNA-binding response OmpR family regulator